MKLSMNIHTWVELVKRFSRSEVRGQGHMSIVHSCVHKHVNTIITYISTLWRVTDRETDRQHRA